MLIATAAATATTTDEQRYLYGGKSCRAIGDPAATYCTVMLDEAPGYGSMILSTVPWSQLVPVAAANVGEGDTVERRPGRFASSSRVVVVAQDHPLFGRRAVVTEDGGGHLVDVRLDGSSSFTTVRRSALVQTTR